MPNEFTAIIEQDEEWFIAYCPEIPGANGQGKTKEEARSSLADAIALILQDRREDALRADAKRKLGVIRSAVRHDFPTGDVEQMLREIQSPENAYGP